MWFGCDVGKEYHRSLAVMDTGLFDYESVYKTTTTLTKKERLEYGQSLMTVSVGRGRLALPVLLAVRCALHKDIAHA